jgi:hypothetical protein
MELCGAAFLGPPGLVGESLTFSVAWSQSFLTGGGTGVEKVAIETSPIQWKIQIGLIFQGKMVFAKLIFFPPIFFLLRKISLF